jgi:hypothetical protein
MKRTFAILAISALAAGCATGADGTHEHPAQAAKPAALDMQNHMKLMQAQMSQISAATDPKERERLMNEHMKTMQESMTKMQGMMGCAKMM